MKDFIEVWPVYYDDESVRRVLLRKADIIGLQELELDEEDAPQCAVLLPKEHPARPLGLDGYYLTLYCLDRYDDLLRRLNEDI